MVQATRIIEALIVESKTNPWSSGMCVVSRHMHGISTH